MEPDKRYWLDADAIIWGNRDLFPIDDVRIYWDWLETKMQEGLVVTHKKVYAEVIAGATGKNPDPIAVWVKARKHLGLTYECTEDSKALAGEISAYVLQRHGFKLAKKFLSGSDPLLIARAAVDKGVVVTQESTEKHPRIPGICDHFKVEHTSLNKMNVTLKIKLG